MKLDWQPAPETALEARGVVVCFGASRDSARTVVSVDRFHIRRGVITGLVGESGSGKSQFLHALLGLTRGAPGLVAGEAMLQPEPGQVIPLLQTFSPDSPPRFVGSYRELGRVVSVFFQGADSHLNPFHTIRKQLLRRAEILPGDPVAEAGGRNEFVRRTLAALFPDVSDLESIASRLPSELSGGQRIRVGLSLALVSRAPILLADEPTTGLDPGLRQEIYQRLRHEVERDHRTLLIVSHDVDLVAAFAPDIWIMRRGQMVEHTSGEGSPGLRDDYSRLLFAPLDRIAEEIHSPTDVSARRAPPAAPARTNSDAPAVLRVEELGKRFLIQGRRNGQREIAALRGVSFEIRRGECVGLVGESGCGKSTLARLVAGLLSPDQGSIRFYEAGEETPLSPRHPNYRQRVQILHQNPDSLLHPRVTVGTLCRDSMQLWREACRFREVEDFLDFAHLDRTRAEQKPASLSGGERRRLGLSRILAGRPELILADEVVSGLDRVLQARIYFQLQLLRAEGLTILVISHDLDLVRRLCDRLLIMRHGRIVDRCTTSDLRLEKTGHHPYTRFLLQAVSLQAGEGSYDSWRGDSPKEELSL